MRSFFCKTVVTFLSLTGQSLSVADHPVVEVDTAVMQGMIRDLLGVNRKPGFIAKSLTNTTSSISTPNSTYLDAGMLYSAFGISQVRLHDDDIDLCKVYTAAKQIDASGNSSKEVTNCKSSGTSGPPHLIWTPISSADAELDNPANYDFTRVDEAVRKTLATGAGVYLRLGESFNGPNDTDDPVAWAKVATNIYRHVIGVFKPTTDIAVDPVFVEVHNEPDGVFWRGTTTTFNTLFIETVQRVKNAASAAGRTVKVGGPGFTTNLLTNATRTGSTANGFVGAVSTSGLDFFSTHYYGNCATATLSDAASYFRNVRTLVNNQGGSNLPLQITEWNIGLGERCGNAFYGQQRTQSYASGILTLMQDPVQNIEAAYFYAGVPIMALFDMTSVGGKAMINPSAWSFWAHTKLKGANALSAKVCTSNSNCVMGYAAESAPLLALAGQKGDALTVIVTNDNANSNNYTLRVKGLNASSLSATVLNPPEGIQQLTLSGNPGVPESSAVQNVFNSVSGNTHESLSIVGSQAELSLSILPYSIQVVELSTGAIRDSDFVITPVLSGNNSSLTLSAQISVASNDIGKSGAFYVAANLQDRWFVYIDNSWLPWTGGELPASEQVTILPSTKNIEILKQFDASAFIGTMIYAGYGLSLDDMLTYKKYALVYQVNAESSNSGS